MRCGPLFSNAPSLSLWSGASRNRSMCGCQSEASPKWAASLTLDRTSTISILDRMMQRGVQALPTKTRPWGFNGKGQAARGDEICQWLLRNGVQETKEVAKETALQLVYAQGLIPLQRVETAEKAFVSSSETFYAHYALSVAKSQGLNLFMYGKKKGERRDVFDVLDEISQVFIPFLGHIVLREGKGVDYRKVRESPQWVRLLELLIELSTSSLANVGDVPDDFKLACLCNLYNVLIIHGKMVFGPSDILQRGPFFDNCAYNICGTRLSSTELEQGLLRLKMKDDHPLAALRVAKKDPRIHFILNCGANSCPPLVAINTKKDIDAQLDKYTANFIADNTNVKVDLAAQCVELSRLWKWFRVDFTPDTPNNDMALLTWIREHAPENIAESIFELQQKIHQKIHFNVYDWGDNGDPNSSDTKLMSIYDLSFKKNA